MSTIKSIIKNELDKRLGRIALSEDINEAIQYIDDWLFTIKEPNLLDVLEALDGFVHDNYARCEYCGEYHKFDEIEHYYGREVCQKPSCRANAYDDYKFNPQKEWGTY